jgi:diketogulonate reductase-like aldo/keto reductase
VKADRGAWVPIDERTYAVVDELEIIAKAHDTSVAAVALAWVQAQPGVSSTIIGARRMSQLDANVNALDVKLTADDFAHLGGLSKPKLGFPQSMQPLFPAIHNGGTTINGVTAPSMMIQPGDKPY